MLHKINVSFWMFPAVQAEIFPSDLCYKSRWLILDILQDRGEGREQITHSQNIQSKIVIQTIIISNEKWSGLGKYFSDLSSQNVVMERSP